MVAITEDMEDTTEVMEAPLGAEPAAGAVVAVASAVAVASGVVAAPHLEPGLLLDSAAQGGDEEKQQPQQPSRLSLRTYCSLFRFPRNRNSSQLYMRVINPLCDIPSLMSRNTIQNFSCYRYS